MEFEYADNFTSGPEATTLLIAKFYNADAPFPIYVHRCRTIEFYFRYRAFPPKVSTVCTVLRNKDVPLTMRDRNFIKVE